MTPPKCLNPSCTQPARTRGLCRDCYAAALYQVLSKRTTWRKLEKAGKSLPLKQTRARSNWILAP